VFYISIPIKAYPKFGLSQLFVLLLALQSVFELFRLLVSRSGYVMSLLSQFWRNHDVHLKGRPFEKLHDGFYAGEKNIG
jgi:hypothetical protein